MRILGHPVHPILVAFPIALFSLGTVCDLVALIADLPALAQAGRLCLIVGLASAVLALVTGVVDFLPLASSSPAMATAVRHGVLAFSATSSFGMALVLRGPGPIPATLALAIEVVSLVLIGAAGWFGGHLVFHHGVGVRDGRR